MAAPLPENFGAGLSATPVAGLRIVPVRHHSPACARALSELMARERPSRVLVEMPADFQPLLPVLQDPAARAPVAAVALLPSDDPDRPDLSGLYPFSAHAPEWIAIREAGEADVTFIDRPAGARLSERSEEEENDLFAPPTMPLMQDDPMDAFVPRLTRQVGARDQHETWDCLFEARLGGDAEALLRDVLAYGAAVRREQDAGLAKDNAARETHMIWHLAHALRDRRDGDGPVFCVVGAAHAPPLIDAARCIADGEAVLAPDPAPEAEVFAIRYGMADLDAYAAYGAGLPSPGWYDRAWMAGGREGKADLMALAGEAVLGFRRTLEDPPPLTAALEALRHAHDLARLRGLPGPMRSEIEDALRAAFPKAEADAEALVAEMRRFLAGTALGDLPASAGAPPLLRSVRLQAGALKIDTDDSATRTRRLSVRSNAAHARLSAFLHGLDLIGVPLGHLVSGPDLAEGRGLDRIVESWELAWTTRVEAALVAAAPRGATLRAAALAEIGARFDALATGGEARDLGRAVTLLGRGAVAGLGVALAPHAAHLRARIEAETRFDTLVDALVRLRALDRGLRARPTGTGFDVADLTQATWRRVRAEIPRLCAVPEAEVEEIVTALRDACAVGRSEGMEGWEDAVARLARTTGAQPGVLGAALALAMGQDAAFAERLVGAVVGTLDGIGLDGAARVAVLRGAMAADPGVIWSANGLIDALDGTLTDLDESDFLALLPDLRHAFTDLNPRETDRLADAIATRHGGAGGQLTGSGAVPLGLATHGAEVERAVQAALAADGLDAWAGAAQ